MPALSIFVMGFALGVSAMVVILYVQVRMTMREIRKSDGAIDLKWGGGEKRVELRGGDVVQLFKNQPKGHPPDKAS